MTYAFGIIDEGFFLRPDVLQAVLPIFSKVATNVYVVLCSPPVDGMAENMLVRTFRSGRDGNHPLLQCVAYTVCAACDLQARMQGSDHGIDGGCAHMPQNGFPWMAVDESTREETELRIAVGGAGLRTISPAVVAEMFRDHPRSQQVDDGMVIAVDPGGGASLTAAIAGVLTPLGVDILGMFRSTDTEQQAVQFRDFVIGMMNKYGSPTIYIYIEKNYAPVVGQLVSVLNRTIYEENLGERVLLMREPGSIGTGVGLNTTAESKKWIGRMFYDWISAGWFRVIQGAEMVAYIRGGEVAAARERIVAEFADHVSHVIFGDSAIQFKQGGNDDWVIAAGLLLHAFLCASLSLRNFYTRISPGSERPFRLDAVILLPEMLMHYSPKHAYVSSLATYTGAARTR